MAKLRILVVEDSLTVRRHLCEVVSGDPDLELVGEADEGNQAIAMVERLRPDVITLDMVLPGRNGLEITEHVMAYCPTPILIVSSSINRGDLFKTYDALAAGAVEVMEKGCGAENPKEWDRRFLATVKLVARIKVITHLRLKLARLGMAAAPSSAVAPPLPHPTATSLVAMGGSTGAPSAVAQILRQLPADFPLPILLVIHIGGPLGGAFADWLGTHSRIPARYPTDGEPQPRWGTPLLLVAPPDRHMVLREGRVHLTADPPRHSCRPSVDVLFESVANEVGAQAVACLLTGMGKDGADGLQAVRRAGGLTVAQDEATSVVFGMPREAILRGSAERVLALSAIAPLLVGLADQSHSARRRA